MAEDVKPPVEDKIRKTISQTHKQAFISYGSAMALSALLVGPLSKFFQTKEDAATQAGVLALHTTQLNDLKSTQDKEFAEVKLLISGNQDELVHKLERFADKVAERMKDAESREIIANQGQDRRIDTLEQAVLQSARKSKTN